MSPALSRTLFAVIRSSGMKVENVAASSLHVDRMNSYTLRAVKEMGCSRLM